MSHQTEPPRDIESLGGETCTAAYPAGPRTSTHSLATEFQFQFHNFTIGPGVGGAAWAGVLSAPGTSTAAPTRALNAVATTTL